VPCRCFYARRAFFGKPCRTAPDHHPGISLIISKEVFSAPCRPPPPGKFPKRKQPAGSGLIKLSSWGKVSPWVSARGFGVGADVSVCVGGSRRSPVSAKGCPRAGIGLCGGCYSPSWWLLLDDVLSIRQRVRAVFRQPWRNPGAPVSR
jgi:hypothetical protein